MAPRPLPRSVRLAISSALVALLVAACANGTPVKDSGSGGGATTTTAGGADVCRLDSCDSNRECGACTEGNQTCLLAEHRCVACDPQVGGCPDGAFCSEFGACVPQGQTCITNDNGTPTITCASNADCLACDSLHQVCDGESSRCVTCTDADVSACGGPSVCNANRCAECSPTVACPDGKICAADGTCETGTSSSTGTGGSTCAHAECTAGAPLSAMCSACATLVCTHDSYCCTTKWDASCVGEVTTYCSPGC